MNISTSITKNMNISVISNIVLDDNSAFAKGIRHNVDFEHLGSVLKTGTFFKNLFSSVICFLVYLLGGIVTILIYAGSGISIISVAFQRIIKPLIILPFSTIVLGIGACSGEGERVMWHYGKTFFGYCISGAFIILAISLGTILGQNIVPADNLGAADFVGALLGIASLNITVIATTGLVKSVDSIVAKTFG